METIVEVELPLVPRGNAQRPLLGLTILLVEDSRYCSEAVRLLCLRSGARLRRADCQKAAYRHLATYRPSLVIVDIGLPDGSGLDMIRELASHRPNAPVILATSGDDPTICAKDAAAAGADGYLPKPLKNIRYFQSEILRRFPDRDFGDLNKVVPLRPEVEPDDLAIAEDLQHVRDLMNSAIKEYDDATLTYCVQFLFSVADAKGEGDLIALAEELAENLAESPCDVSVLAPLAEYIRGLPAIFPRMR